MNKNIYFKIFKIFIDSTNCSIEIINIFDDFIELQIDKDIIKLNKNETINVDLKKLDFQIIVKQIETELMFNYNFKDMLISGFSPESIIETTNGPKNIKDISNSDILLDTTGDNNNINIENIIIFRITSKQSEQPIIIDKSNCGLNLPYAPIIMSIKNNLKIKKIILKGRQLYLNGKAKLYKYDKYIDFYNIETENKQDFFIAGFITDSY
jgi:hypothetical protein|uniref:Uncharacterized protein n=1 Tax=viral metagenome TaxID=1070528 RepID=A0A6C0ITZ6_9ZZZZ